jgi:hypothetical protein
MKKKAPRKRKVRPVLTIGRRETVDFPDLGLFGLTAKIDTGANTTALHCHHVRVEDGVLYFRLLDETHPEYQARDHRFEEFEQKTIKSSFGESELRYIIRTKITLGKRTIRGIVSLTDRANMRYRQKTSEKSLSCRCFQTELPFHQSLTYAYRNFITQPLPVFNSTYC